MDRRSGKCFACSDQDGWLALFGVASFVCYWCLDRRKDRRKYLTYCI